MVANAHASVFAEPEYRVEGPLKVTGHAHYAADAKGPDMLWAAYVRSPHSHALIGSIDTAAARALPGLLAVLSADDLPLSARFGRRLQDYPVLCRHRVRFIGDGVAAVAAETRERRPSLPARRGGICAWGQPCRERALDERAFVDLWLEGATLLPQQAIAYALRGVDLHERAAFSANLNRSVRHHVDVMRLAVML